MFSRSVHPPSKNSAMSTWKDIPLTTDCCKPPRGFSSAITILLSFNLNLATKGATDTITLVGGDELQ